MQKNEFLNADSVGRLADRLSGVERIGLDTEFMRERTYFPQLCLVQVATEDGIWCADPLGASELDRVWNTLTECLWVVHAGRQDIEVIFQTAGRMPRGLFDTQVAAGLLGYAPQLGYAALVSELFGVELAKSHTRANWARRPLTPELLEYAAEDVLHLLPAADRLSERLEAVGRLPWAIEDSSDLLDETLYSVQPNAAIDRLKGARYLCGRARAAARRLAAWREREALQRNRPRQWILSDALLLELASAGPATTGALSRVPGIPAGTVRRVGDELLAALDAAAADNDTTAPPSKPGAQHRSKLAAMQSRVAACATELAVLPEIVASKKELTAALFGERQSRVFRGWRRALIGDALLEVLED